MLDFASFILTLLLLGSQEGRSFLSLYLQPSALPHGFPAGTWKATCPKIIQLFHLLSASPSQRLSKLEPESYLHLSHPQTFSHIAQVSYLTYHVLAWVYLGCPTDTFLLELAMRLKLLECCFETTTLWESPRWLCGEAIWGKINVPAGWQPNPQPICQVGTTTWMMPGEVSRRTT